jgi:hypothetical protein
MSSLRSPRALQRAGIAIVAGTGIIFIVAGCTSSSSKTAASGPAASSGSAAASSAPAVSGPSAGTSASSSAKVGGQASKGASSGSIHSTVPSVTRKTVAPVALTGTADFGTGVSANVTSVTAVKTTAQGPGEISGPGVRVVVVLDNDTSKAIDLDTVVMTVSDAKNVPGSPMSASGSQAFHGTLNAHAKATGIYVFDLPTGHRNPVTVNFSYSASAPVALFVGAVK